MTGSPSRLALAATLLSGVMAVPASACDGETDTGDGDGVPAALVCGCKTTSGRRFLTAPRCARFPDTLTCGNSFFSCFSGVACAGGVAVCATPGLGASEAPSAITDVEMRREWNE